MQLKDKIVVVAGSAGVIGRCSARAIADEGATVIVADVDRAAADTLAAEIAAGRPGRAEAARLDITSAESIDALVAEIAQRHGRIDAVVNCAYPRNRNYGRKLEDVTYADFCDNTGLHLGGYFLVMQRFCIAFRRQGGGNVVNFSSIYGMMAPRFEIYAGTPMTMPVEYAAIKAGIVHLTRYFAQYYKADGIRVNAVSPGGILAGQPEAFVRAYGEHCGRKGMLEPRDVTGTLLFLLSDHSRYVTGQDIVVDDGFSL